MVTRAEVLLVRDGRAVPVGRLAQGHACDLDLVDRLVRIQLAARRRGGRIILRDVSQDLRELLVVAGLTDLFVGLTPSTDTYEVDGRSQVRQPSGDR